MAIACSYTQWVVIGLLILVAILIVMQTMKPKEGFKMQMDPAQLVKAVEGVSARPSFPGVTRTYDGIQGASLLGGVNMSGGLPAQANVALEDLAANGVKTEFAEMGGAEHAPGTMTSKQAQDMLQQSMNGGKPEYQEAVLPLGSIEHSVDPTNPVNFMYDRTVFAPLKRQYGNGVDFIRGDIDVKQEFRGWFDVRPATDKDIVTGYFDRYIDIQQQTALKDAQFTRSTPVEALWASQVNPAGLQATSYAFV